MLVETWIAYSIAALVILVIPGPTILLVVSQSLVHGPKAAMPLVLGVAVGDLVAMLTSMLGLGVVLATSATLFTVLKLIGAIYLIYLGCTLWLSSPDTADVELKPALQSPFKHFYSAFVVTALNPKGIVFFIAFVPQFLDRSLPAAPQLFIFGATFLVLACVNATVYAIFAARVRNLFQRRTPRRWFNRAGGTALIGAGPATAAMQRS